MLLMVIRDEFCFVLCNRRSFRRHEVDLAWAAMVVVGGRFHSRLDAQRQTLSAEDGEIQARYEALRRRVGIYAAFGG